MIKEIKFICKTRGCKFVHEATIYSMAGYEIEKAKALKHLDEHPNHVIKRVK